MMLREFVVVTQCDKTRIILHDCCRQCSIQAARAAAQRMSDTPARVSVSRAILLVKYTDILNY
jgi:hypothetical protein